jgi:hypothetical protein
MAAFWAPRDRRDLAARPDSNNVGRLPFCLSSATRRQFRSRDCGLLTIDTATHTKGFDESRERDWLLTPTR